MLYIVWQDRISCTTSCEMLSSKYMTYLFSPSCHMQLKVNNVWGKISEKLAVTGNWTQGFCMAWVTSASSTTELWWPDTDYIHLPCTVLCILFCGIEYASVIHQAATRINLKHNSKICEKAANNVKESLPSLPPSNFPFFQANLTISLTRLICEGTQGSGLQD